MYLGQGLEVCLDGKEGDLGTGLHVCVGSYKDDKVVGSCRQWNKIAATSGILRGFWKNIFPRGQYSTATGYP